MNASEFHLMINHFPIIGLMIGFLILLAGYIIKHPIVKRTALGIIIFAALAAPPTYLSGEEAEDIVEELAITDHDTIEEHEEAAYLFLIMMILTGIVAALTLFMDIKNKPLAPMLYHTTFGITLIAMFFAFNTGSTGGEIYHAEKATTAIDSNKDHDE